MFFVEISTKYDKFGHLNPILRKLGVMHDLGWLLIRKLIELFSLSVMVAEL